MLVFLSLSNPSSGCSVRFHRLGNERYALVTVATVTSGFHLEVKRHDSAVSVWFFVSTLTLFLPLLSSPGSAMILIFIVVPAFWYPVLYPVLMAAPNTFSFPLFGMLLGEVPAAATAPALRSPKPNLLKQGGVEGGDRSPPPLIRRYGSVVGVWAPDPPMKRWKVTLVKIIWHRYDSRMRDALFLHPCAKLKR